MFLQVKNINAYYGRAQVLHDISFDIEKGEMVFLIGRNGAGKTTLLRTIAGFISSFDGEIAIEGSDVGDWGLVQTSRYGIRYVYQDKRVFKKITVRDHLEIAAKGYGVPMEDAVHTALRIYPELETFFDTPAEGLSGGQRQLLLIGRALIGNPKLILIDEPTEGLAAVVINKIGSILNELKGETTMLIVEQNLSIVEKLADKVLTIKEGILTHEFSSENIPDKKALEVYL